EEGGAEAYADRGEVERMRVAQPDFHRDPRISPDDDHRDERRDRYRSPRLHEVASAGGRERMVIAGPWGDFQRRSFRSRLSSWATTSASKPPSGEGAALAIVPAAWSPKASLYTLSPGTGDESPATWPSAMRRLRIPRYCVRATISWPG